MTGLPQATGYAVGDKLHDTLAAAVPLLVSGLFTRSRVELRLHDEFAGSMSGRDEIALGTLVEIAADAGRPFTVLLAPPYARRPPFVALVSYSERFESDPFGACHVCGCTEDDCRLCVERTGQPCRWVKWPDRFAGVPGLCSACAEVRP